MVLLIWHWFEYRCHRKNPRCIILALWLVGFLGRSLVGDERQACSSQASRFGESRQSFGFVFLHSLGCIAIAQVLCLGSLGQSNLSIAFSLLLIRRAWKHRILSYMTTSCKVLIL